MSDPQSPPETFGARLARLRIKANLTRAELAEAVGMHRSMIHRLETGSRGAGTPLSTLHRLAEALGVGAADLLD